MPEIFTNAKASLVLHRLIIIRFILFTVGALCSSILTALAGTNWHDADPQTKFMIIVGIVGSWGMTMSAFLDKSMARIAQGENPFSESTQPAQVTTSTEVINKTTVEPAK